MRKVLSLLTILILATSLLGCSLTAPNEQPDDNNNNETARTETYTLFYGDKNNERFVTEEREITYLETEDKYKAILEELIKGPENNEYLANIAKNTKVYGTIKQNNDLIINFSQEFNQFAGSIAEIIGVGSVVNTMTNNEDINRVKILVEGEELIGPSGNPRGFMTEFANNEVIEPVSKTITLYFSNQDATGVIAEERKIVYDANATREMVIQLILEELIKGPENNNLYKTIPKEVKIISVSIEKNIAVVDFSEEMHTKHWGGATGESLTIASIVNTLTELYDIDLVKMTVEDNPLSIEHVILEEPVGRNEDLIIH